MLTLQLALGHHLLTFDFYIFLLDLMFPRIYKTSLHPLFVFKSCVGCDAGVTSWRSSAAITFCNLLVADLVLARTDIAEEY